MGEQKTDRDLNITVSAFILTLNSINTSYSQTIKKQGESICCLKERN